MNISIIIAHPLRSSFNHAIGKTLVESINQQAHSVRCHDLYEENFPPALPPQEVPRGAPLPDMVQTHCRELAEADGIIVIHPNWWGMPPAIMKGWIDRVFRPGIAYEFIEGDSGEGIPKGLLKAQFALVLNTSNTTPEREEKEFGDPLETLWKNCIFGLCGVPVFRRRTFSIMVASTKGQRADWLDEARNLAAHLISEK
ncbi:MAG: flavodoxin family protein [Chitinivibrionales bacterium]|nr:flavodoxin family protein [Chitinivibrionales bacterium]